MYPIHYFSLFPPFPRDNEVFVAMSFDPRFTRRWETVIAPAIESVQPNNIPLRAHRVDTRHIGDSILTEILGGISRARIVFADITSLGHLDDKPMRNGNVLYEVGIAHAVRLPEEVLLFRSDSDPLLFDVSNVRVNNYDPDNDPEQARKQVAGAIVEAVRELDLKRELSVRSAAESLDYSCWMMLAESHANGGARHLPTRTMVQAMGNAAWNSAISRLLAVGAIRTEYNQITAEMLTAEKCESGEHLFSYQPTGFGTAVLHYASERMGFGEPSLQPLFEQLAGEQNGGGGESA